MAIHVPPGAEIPSPVDARDAQVMIEMKFDHVEKSRPPKLHDQESGAAVCSTYGTATPQGSKCTPVEQILDYNCLALAAQGPVRHHMFGLLITVTRLQIVYADRAGCMISEERNFDNDFSILFAVLIGLYRSEAQRAGLQSGIRSLSVSSGTSLDPSDFDTSDKVVKTGAMANISRPITPFQALVQLTSAPAEFVDVFARGANLMERPVAIDWEAAQSSIQHSMLGKPLRSRPSIPRLAKSLGLEKNQAIVALQGESSPSRSVNLPRQFAPRSIFGSGTARYHCVVGVDTPGVVGSTLQLSWQPKSRLSEATVLRIANDHGIQGVPTLIASNDVASTGDSLIRSRLQHKFAGLPSIRPVNNVLRAIVWREDCIPLSSVDDMHDFLSASQSILQSKL